MHVHFIGIAGSAIAPIAVMMKKKGWRVTGSDDGVYEPALSLLNNNGIEWYEGYKPESIAPADLIILGGATIMKDEENVEYLEAKKLGKQIEGYAYLLGEYCVKEESIVVTGSYGKTTTTAMINWILEVAGKNPSFMIGGQPLNFETGVRSTESHYSALEGDEYLSVFGVDNEPRFIYYRPKYAIISATKWDHTNVYLTEQSYIEAFQKLAKLVNGEGKQLIVCASGENNDKAVQAYDKEPITYMLEGRKNLFDKEPDYLARDISHKEDASYFTVDYQGEKLGEFSTTQFGDHNVENCLAAISVTHLIGIAAEDIHEGIKTFKGIKRRLEDKGTSPKGAKVIEDFAHSAVKAQATLDALRTRYKDSKIISLYLPRMSARDNRQELEFYPGAFDKADHVIVPRIPVKKSTPKEDRVYGKDYVEYIGKTQPNVHYIPREEDVVKFLDENSDENTIIVFMSASGWGELMERAVKGD